MTCRGRPATSPEPERHAPPEGARPAPTDLAASVVIPAFDAAATIERAVRGVAEQRDARGRPVETIVVDDGSRDDTAAVAERAGARVVRLAQRGGPARARNRGVALARAPIVIFTDADCAARPGFVAALVAALDDAAVTGAKGAYVTAQRALVARFVQVEHEERYDRLARRASIDFVDTYAAAYRREALLAAGGFDERYDRPSTEDQELSFRLAARGARLVFVPEARTEHLHAATVVAYARKKAKIGTFKAATLRAHPGKAVSDSYTPVVLKLQLLLAPLAVAGFAFLAASVVGAAELADTFHDDAQLATALELALRSPAGLAALGAVVALVVSSLPLVRRALRKRDLAVALATPGLVLVRGCALGLGLAVGLAREAALGGVLRRAPVPAGSAAEDARAGEVAR